MAALRPHLPKLALPAIALATVLAPLPAAAQEVINTGLGFGLNITGSDRGGLYVLIGLARLALGILCILMVAQIVKAMFMLKVEGEKTESHRKAVQMIKSSVISILAAIVVAGLLPWVGGVIERVLGQS